MWQSPAIFLQQAISACVMLGLGKQANAGTADHARISTNATIGRHLPTSKCYSAFAVRCKQTPAFLSWYAVAMETILTREVSTQRGKRLEYFTIVWNTLEGVVAIFAGVVAGSISLVGFGLIVSLKSHRAEYSFGEWLLTPT